MLSASQAGQSTCLFDPPPPHFLSHLYLLQIDILSAKLLFFSLLLFLLYVLISKFDENPPPLLDLKKKRDPCTSIFFIRQTENGRVIGYLRGVQGAKNVFGQSDGPKEMDGQVDYYFI